MTACVPSSAIARACAAASTVPAACAAPARADSATSSPTARTDSTARTWRSPPDATSPTAAAISPTARPASSEVAARFDDASLSVPAVWETSPTMSRSRSVIVRKAWPSVSRSERGSTSRLRSPPAIASAVAAVSRSEVTIAPNAPAMRPTSSFPPTCRVTSRSPSAICSAAAATSRTGRLIRLAMNTRTPPITRSASRPTRMSVVRRRVTAESISSLGATATKLQPPVLTGA